MIKIHKSTLIEHEQYLFATFSSIYCSSGRFELTQSQVNDRLIRINTKNVCLKRRVVDSCRRIEITNMCNSHTVLYGSVIRARYNWHFGSLNSSWKLFSFGSSIVSDIYSLRVSKYYKWLWHSLQPAVVTNDWMQSVWWFCVWQETFPLLESNSICSLVHQSRVIAWPTPTDYLVSCENHWLFFFSGRS